MTVVHSTWAAEELARRSPGASVVCVPPAVRLPPPAGAGAEDGATVFGAVGGHPDRDRLALLVEAFGEVERELRRGPAGESARPTTPTPTALRVRDLVRDSGLGGVAAVGRASGRRRPGRRAPALRRVRRPHLAHRRAHGRGGGRPALGSGRPVIASDAPQYRELGRVAAGWCRRTRLGSRRPSPPGCAGRPRTRPACARRAARPPSSCGRRSRPSPGGHVRRANGNLLWRPSGRRVRPACTASASVPWSPSMPSAAGRRRPDSPRRLADAGRLLDAGVEVAIEDFDYGAPRDPRAVSPTGCARATRGAAPTTSTCGSST